MNKNRQFQSVKTTLSRGNIILTHILVKAKVKKEVQESYKKTNIMSQFFSGVELTTF